MVCLVIYQSVTTQMWNCYFFSRKYHSHMHVAAAAIHGSSGQVELFTDGKIKQFDGIVTTEEEKNEIKGKNERTWTRWIIGHFMT